MSTLQSTLRISLLDDFTARSRHITRALDGLRAQQLSAFAPMRGLIGQTIALGAGYFGVRQGLGATAGAAIDFESAFADVRKVVDATDEQFENMRRAIRGMSNEMPLAATEIAALFAAAGEAGVATADLTAFSKMAARTGIAFGMTAEEAGDSLAKLKTQLGLSVAETGDLADTINHLSNNMASSAKDVTEFMLRIGAFGEMGGFVKEDLAAIGSAMIATGADASTAGTAMQNVIRALTKGGSAQKAQRDAAKALGLHLPSIAKDMQKDAKGTMRKVLEAVAKAPKDRQVSLLSQFFGDEARAFMPLVNNIELLDQALGSVSDRTKYAGSAFREYVERASTTANVLDLLRNKVSNVFSEFGDSMLPGIRAAALGIGDIIDTLGERVSIFDEMRTAVQGFMNGLGMTGGIREMIAELGDVLFGEVDPSGGADRLGRIFMQFKEWGSYVRELNQSLKENPLVRFFGEIAGYGFKIFMWSTGISLLAGAVMQLARGLFLLSGASTIVGILKAVGSIAAIVGGGGAAATAGGAGTAAAGAAGAAAGVTRSTSMLRGLSRMGMFGLAAAGAWDFGKAVYSGDTPWKQGKAWLPGPEDALHSIGSALTDRSWWIGDAAKEDFDFRAHMGIPVGGPGNAGDRPVKIDGDSLRQLVTPTGTQDVRMVNPQPPDVTVNASFNITGVVDPRAAANAAADQLGDAVKSAVEGSYSD